MKIAFCWDDGALEDRKLFALHEKYQIPGMFFVPTRNRENRAVIDAATIKAAKSNIISFGGHTYNHAYLDSIPLRFVEDEVRSNQIYLEDILGDKVEHFCLPGGRYNKKIIDIVYKHFKTIRAATTMNFKYQGGLLKPSIQVYPRRYKSLVVNTIRNNSYPELAYFLKNSGKTYFELILGVLVDVESNRENSVVIFWGHSWEIEKYNLWGELETIFSFIKIDLKDSIAAYGELFENIQMN